MAEKPTDKNIGLSKQDADLWQRVTNTIDQSESVRQTGPKESVPNELSPKIEPDTDDFAKLLDSAPERINDQTAPIAPDQNPPKTKSRPEVPRPTTEDFAAMLDGKVDFSKTDNPVAPPQSSEQRSLPSYSPPTVTDSKTIPNVEAFNKRDVRKITSGKQTIEAAIDLHGLTQREAKSALKIFLNRAQGDNKRFVLIITGKGQRRSREERSFEMGAPEPGVLRRQVPLWLDEMTDQVISYGTAHKKHGGEGALYVRLKKQIKRS